MKPAYRNTKAILSIENLYIILKNISLLNPLNYELLMAWA